MTVSNPEVQAILVTCIDGDGETILSRGVRLIENHDPSCVNGNWNYEPLVRLSDYEALQKQKDEVVATLNDLKGAAKELAEWCYFDVDADPGVTPGLEKIMDLLEISDV